MTKKQYPKLTISLKKEDEEQLLKLRAIYESIHKRQFSLADVVRDAIKYDLNKFVPSVVNDGC